MKRWMLALGMLAVAGSVCAESWKPPVRWRGFNLLGMFVKGNSEGTFPEKDFRLIHELGFNFVRLPMDYRYWAQEGNWAEIDEAKVAPIDRAVAYGKKHNLHVQLCFHRAPGYTVARPPETRDLFTDDEALRVCAKHWAFFAKRYKGIPSEELSFNLFNEPAEVPEAAYHKVAAALVAAIRKEDPARFIIADGIKWGTEPAKSLFDLKIGQATRGYAPMSVSHYLASWVGTPKDDPVWPPSQAVSPLFGPAKAPLNVPLIIERVPAGKLALKLGVVSGKMRLRVTADGAAVLDKVIEAGDGPEWEDAVHKEEWKIWQSRYKPELTAALPNGAQRLEIALTDGDWAQLSKVTLTGADGEAATLSFEQTWGKTNAPFTFAGFAARPAFRLADGAEDGMTYLRKRMAAWQPALDAGVYVMVGEFGAFNRTPHTVVLPWLEDNLKVWKEYGLGWAVWNFRGSFGILDSGRDDVAYEDFEGHKLDRKMLELLQKY